jgi:hypothetical protein
MEFTKDAMITFKNPAQSTTKTGKDFYKLYLEADQAQELATILAEKGAENGVRIDLYFGEGTNKATGHTFMKSFAFIKPKKAGPVGQAGGFSAPKKAVAVDNKEDMKKKIEETRAKLASKQIK